MEKNTSPAREMPRRSRIGLVDYMAQPDNRKAYLQWLRDPITAVVLDLVENSIRPVQKPPTETAERYSGIVDGRYETLRLIQTLDQIYEAITASQSAGVEETYGLEGLLTRTFGYSPEEAAEIVRKNKNSE